ncbi:MAG: protein-export chaperone SecB [Clostridia bacterium]|nr:protein-export chaperone SecB [Clostridia bacterium]
MTNVQLKAYKVSRINFNNAVQSTVQLKLNNKVSHNVKYTNGAVCEATLCIEVLDKDHPDVLSITVEVKGIFDIRRGVEKEFVHVDTFKELFPLAKALVTTVTANAGIKPIIVQNIDIEEQEIYRFDMKGAEEENS